MKFNLTAVEKTVVQEVPVASISLPLKGIKIEGSSVYFESEDGVVCLEGSSRGDLQELEAQISDAAAMFRQSQGVF